MPVPSPQKNEKQDDFISRCISTLHNEDPNRPNDQIVAMCFTAWREHQKGASHDLNFITSIHQLEAGVEGNLATFYLMNTARNRNKFGVTREALEHALPTLKRVALGCGEGYDVSTHFGKRMKVGEFTKGWMPNGYALGTAKVEDDVVWESLKKGDWGPVSVVIGSFRDVCSKCGEELTGEENPFDHDCIKEGGAYLLIESFRFKRVDFIDRPAYPQAGLTDFGGAAEPTVVAPLELVAGVYESQSITWPTGAGGRGAGSPGVSLKPEEGKEKILSELTAEQLAEKVIELEEKHTELEGQVKTLTKEKGELEKKLEAQAPEEEPEPVEEDPKYKELEAKVKVMEDREHAACLDLAVEARFKAGIVTDKDEERERLADYTDDYLRLLTEDAEKVAQNLEDSESPGPKAKFGKEETDVLTAAVEEKRMLMYGHTRDAAGKVVA